MDRNTVLEIASILKNGFDPDHYQCEPCYYIRLKEYTSFAWGIDRKYLQAKYSEEPKQVQEAFDKAIAVLDAMDLDPLEAEETLYQALNHLSLQYFIDHAENFTS